MKTYYGAAEGVLFYREVKNVTFVGGLIIYSEDTDLSSNEPVISAFDNFSGG